MLKSFMFASHLTSPSNRPRRLQPLHSNPCHPHSNQCHPERSEGSALPFLVAPRRSLLALAPRNAFLATLAVTSQRTENPATLSPLRAALTRRVNLNPFVCHSYKKHPGWGPPTSTLEFHFSLSPTLNRSGHTRTPATPIPSLTSAHLPSPTGVGGTAIARPSFPATGPAATSWSSLSQDSARIDIPGLEPSTDSAALQVPSRCSGAIAP